MNEVARCIFLPSACIPSSPRFFDEGIRIRENTRCSHHHYQHHPLARTLRAVVPEHRHSYVQSSKPLSRSLTGAQ